MISKNKEHLLYTYEGPIEWNITGFGEEEIMEYILIFLKALSNFNYTNPFKTIHGSYICKYNGGRDTFYPADRDLIYNRIKYFNTVLNMGVKLTFSNKNIHKDQFYEDEMQWYLNTLNEIKGIGNGIICVNDDYAELVKKNFADLELVASHVKLVTEAQIGKTDTVDYYNSKFDLYDTVVMNTYRAFDDEFLSKITHPERLELIVNHYCTTNCPKASYHHDIIESIQDIKIKHNYDENTLNTDPNYINILYKQNKLVNECHNFKCNNNLQLLIKQKLNKEEINYLIKEFGITKFKIEGRDAGIIPFLRALDKYIINTESFMDTIFIDNKQL